MKDGGTSGCLALGPGKATLVAFFASWVPGVEQHLTQLNQVVAADPEVQVDAIDVATTEPGMNSNSTQAMLAKMRPLHFPVAVDVAGNIADAYQVTDLMWFTLTNAKGKIIWEHDGWLSAAAAEQAILKAERGK